MNARALKRLILPGAAVDSVVQECREQRSARRAHLGYDREARGGWIGVRQRLVVDPRSRDGVGAAEAMALESVSNGRVMGRAVEQRAVIVVHDQEIDQVIVAPIGAAIGREVPERVGLGYAFVLPVR